jgi:DNA-binding XRE family transcriptional regulator
MGIGKRQPDGKKIVKLREQKGLKQNVLARDAGVSERLLRDIERTNKPVPATTITAIAMAAPKALKALPANVSDDELKNLAREMRKNARKIWMWENFRHDARRPGIRPFEKLAYQLGAAILVDDRSAMWGVYGELMSLASRHRRSHRPAADDGLPLAKMARMILHEGLTELAAAKKVATQMIEDKFGRQHSYEATVERLRKKFRACRLDLFRQARIIDAVELMGKSRPRKNQ